MKSLSVLVCSAFILLFAFGLNACGRSDSVEASREADSIDNRDNLTSEDREFVLYASEMHLGEIDMAKQAREKSTNKDIVKYADSVIEKHVKAANLLSDKMKEQQGIVSSNPSMDTQGHMEFLSPLSGTEYDRQFVDLMIADHQDASNTFKTYLSAVQNKNLKSYLEDVAPGLEDLLRDARELQTKR
jgi:putative membrane protein